MNESLVVGPEWSTRGLDIAAGRFPLQVEGHVMRLVGLLVPGVTTVTPHGRYYALHGLVASEAARRELGQVEALDLLRRCEVVLGAVSVLHEGEHDGLPRAHGAEHIGPRLRAGVPVDLGLMSTPGKAGYVAAERGFWGPYVGSEQLLEIVMSSTRLTPGPRCDRDRLVAGLGDVLELAHRDSIDIGELSQATHLCVCSGARAADGEWLRSLMCDAPSPDEEGSFAKLAVARRDTIRLLGRVVAAGGAVGFSDAFKSQVAFGSFLRDDPVASTIEAASIWRGTLLRHYSVGSWRRIWSWLVDQVVDLTPLGNVVDAFVDALPTGTVRSFENSFPPAMVGGEPAPAEEQIRSADGRTLPDRELGVIVLGARRLDALTDATREAFAGRPIELSPSWVARRIDDWQDRPLRDFGAKLVPELLARGRRVAMSKLRRRDDGTIWLPTRLHERGDYLWRTSREGAGDVGLRLDQLGTVLVESGVFERVDGTWALTNAGEVALA